jgi:hypothetical protein
MRHSQLQALQSLRSWLDPAKYEAGGYGDYDEGARTAAIPDNPTLRRWRRAA